MKIRALQVSIILYKTAPQSRNLRWICDCGDGIAVAFVCVRESECGAQQALAIAVLLSSYVRTVKLTSPGFSRRQTQRPFSRPQHVAAAKQPMLDFPFHSERATDGQWCHSTNDVRWRFSGTLRLAKYFSQNVHLFCCKFIIYIKFWVKFFDRSVLKYNSLNIFTYDGNKFWIFIFLLWCLS